MLEYYIGRKVKITFDSIPDMVNEVGIVTELGNDGYIFEVKLEDGRKTYPNSPIHPINPECEFVYLTKEEILDNNKWVTVINSPRLQSWGGRCREAIGYTFQAELYHINETDSFFSNNRPFCVDDDNKFSINYYIESLRLATRDEITLALSNTIRERRGRGSRPHREILDCFGLPIEEEEIQPTTQGPRALGKIDLSKSEIKPKSKTVLPIYTGFKQELLNTILDKPSHIPILKAHSTNRKYYDKVINSFLPYKVGIEIECCDSLSRAMNILSFQDMEKKLNCIDYSDDENVGKTEFCEHRICFNGHKQLMSVYNLTLLLQKHCAINSEAGIHYHFDIPEIKGKSSMSLSPLKAVCKKYLDEIDDILQYKGTYNKKDVYINQRNAWINIQTEFNTIEIRTSGPKFDYKEIITEIILLSQVITKIRNEMNYPKYKLS